MFSKKISEDLVIPGLMYPNDFGVKSLATGKLSYFATGSYQFRPGAYRVKDKTFVPIIDYLNADPFLIVIDHFSGKFSDLIPMPYTSPMYDVHNAISVGITSENRVIFTASCRIDSTCSSNKRNHTVVSGINYNVMNLTESNNVCTLFEYPKFQLMGNGKLVSFERYATKEADVVEYSSDGTSKSTISKVYTPISGLDIRSYVCGVQHDDDSTVLRYFINRIENYRSKQRYLLYMES